MPYTDTKNYKIDFFQVTCENGNFETFVTNDNRSDHFRKRMPVGNYDIIVDTLENTNAFIAGNIIKCKMNDIEPKYNVEAFETSALNLSNVEGLPSASVFLYLKNRKVLLYQAGRSGVATNFFCEYFEKYSGTGKINLSFLISPEVFTKLESFTYISKIDVAIKGLERDQPVSGRHSNNVKSMLDLWRNINSNNIQLVMSKGNRARGLTVAAGKQFVKDIFRLITELFATEDPGSNTGKITISGRASDEDEIEPIDLILKRYRREISIQRAPDSRLNSELYTEQKLTQLKALANTIGNEIFINED